MKFALIGFNCRFTHSCLSLFYLRQELLKNIDDVDININQFTINDPYYPTLMQISRLKADAFFFSVYIWNAGIIKRIINDLAKIQPFSSFILGGPQAIALRADDLPANSTIVSGEIEGIDASFYIDLKCGSLRTSYQGARSKKFHSPFTADDFSDQLANRHIYYESSRGCPYSCSYCISSLEPGIRYKDIQKVREELREILAHKPKSLRFVDRTFNASDKRALEIWQFLHDESEGTTFHFEISPDLFSEEMFLFLQAIQPQLFQFEIGIQSTHEKTLSAISRKSSINTSLDNIKRLVQMNTVHLHVDLILGLPYETFASFGKSFNDIFAVGPHYIQMGLLKVLPQTPLSRQLAEFSIQHCNYPPYEVLATRWLTHAELAELFWFGQCVEAFYNNRYFRAFFRFLQRNGRNGFQFFLDLLESCRKQSFFNRARTQLLMSEILADYIRNDPKSELLKELLIYDWLRSGHRFLPDHLGPHVLKKVKNQLWRELPQEFLPFYNNVSRNNFFKQSLFVRFSGETLQELGLTDGQEGVLCFLNEKENAILELNKVALLCRCSASDCQA
jgi:anaerobic magnesium-protoporphyrin IX monomethyl ester cyclase